MTTEIKICGLTRTREIDYLIDNGVNYAGFVLFYPKSKRCITVNHARRLLKYASHRIKTVAVMVSPDEDQIRAAADVGFDYVQIHGHVSEDLISQSLLPVFLAVNVTENTDIKNISTNENIKAVLFDSKNYGSGKVFDWKILRNIERNDKKLILAGGLNPGNVAEGIKNVDPDIVDVSSGVEDSNGKSLELIRAFVQQVKQLD